VFVYPLWLYPFTGVSAHDARTAVAVIFGKNCHWTKYKHISSLCFLFNDFGTTAYTAILFCPCCLHVDTVLGGGGGFLARKAA